MTTMTHTPPRLYTYMPSPIGRLLLSGDEQRLTALYTLPGFRQRGPDPRPAAAADVPFARVA